MPKFLEVTDKAAAKDYLGIQLDVTDFGATGDGTTNDTTAITNALDAVAAAGGGTLLFPPGTYRIGSILPFKSNTIIRGASTGASILAPHSSLADGNYLFQDPSGGVSNVGIENLTFDMKSRDIIPFRFVRAETSNVRISDNDFINLPATSQYCAFLLSELSDVLVRGNRIIGNVSAAGTSGIILNASASNLMLADNYVYGTATAISCRASHVVIQGNRFEQTGQWGVPISGASYVSVKGNDFNGTWHPGGPADGSAACAALEGASFISITGNTTYQQEFGCYESSDVVISDNVCDSSLSAGVEVSGISSNSYRVTVANNIIKNPDGTGIYAQGEDITVMGNTVISAGTNGCKIATDANDLVSENKRITVIGNSFTNCGRLLAGSGIRIGNADDPTPTSYVIIANNICTDTQSTKTQQYGLSIASALANNITLWGNRFEGNLTAAVNDVTSSIVYGVDTTTAQTLTNKTLTTPTLSSPAISGTPKLAGAWDVTNSTRGAAFGAPAGATNYLSLSGSASTPSMSAAGSSADITMALYPKGTGYITLSDGAGYAVLQTGGSGGTIVNWLRLVNNTTGNAPSLYAVGGDTNISINAIPKGSGTFNVGGTAVLLTGGALGTPSSGTLTNCTGLPVAGITSSTSTALGVGSIELGHASDTTLARSASGVAAVEGNPVAVRVSVPGTATTAGKPGYWAADASYIYTYTGDGSTHTWVRATAASW